MTGHDGDGWVRCELGHRHWGRFGAAGLLGYARDDTGQIRVLLQRRSLMSSHGGTWGLFGGARKWRESAVAAALREAAEECGLAGDNVRIQGIARDDHGRWAYETLVGEVPWPVPLGPMSWETAEIALVAAGAVQALNLHPGFAAYWPVLRDALKPVVIIVDAANVVGARADGWWRDRAGAAARLRDELSLLAARGVASLPAEVGAPAIDRWFPEIVLVLEGAARAATQPDGLRKRTGSNRYEPGIHPVSAPGPAPQGAVPPGPAPQGAVPPGPAPGPVPPGPAPQGAVPPGPAPQGAGQAGPVPPRLGRPGAVSPGAVPAGAVAPGSVPPGPTRPGAVLGGPGAGRPRLAAGSVAWDGSRSATLNGGAAGGAVRVVAAPGSGDDTIARLAHELQGRRLVVTADRDLRRRCQEAGAAVTGPRWLLGLL